MIQKIFLVLVLCSVGITFVSSQRCAAGWYGYSLQSKCYRFVTNNQMTWQDARDFCQIHGGDLLRIDTVAEKNWVFQQLRNLQNRSHVPTSHWWTGLNNQEFLTQWEWADGTATGNFIPWKPGEPNNQNGQERCGEIWNVNQFNDESCATKFKFICYRDRGVPLTCDADNNWQSANGACYKVYTAKKTWNASSLQCDHDGGDIVTIDSVNDEITVHGFAVGANQPLWIGLYTVKNGNQQPQWLWANGTALTTGYWHGIPHIDRNHQNSTCAVISNSLPVKTDWNPSFCTVNRAYVCRKPQGVCLPGWIGHQRNCWQFNAQYKLNFNAATNFCRQQGATLLAIKRSKSILESSIKLFAYISNSDQLFLRSYLDELRDSGVNNFWIGASDNNNNTGNFVWRDGSAVNYKQWAAANNRPANTVNRTDCAYINTNDQAAMWRTTPNCQQARTFICMIPMGRIVNVVTTPRPQYGCPANWQLFQQTCFKVGDRTLDYLSARNVCQQTQGADLAKITSANMQGFVNGIVKRDINYWIGLNDRATDGTYVWNSETTALTGYKNWKPGEPNNYGHSENCVVNINGQWNDYTCSQRIQYICSMVAGAPLGPPPPTTPKSDWTVKCGPGWESNPTSDNCYMLVDEPLSWLDALNQCNNYQGNLVAIETLQEQTYLAGRLKTLNSLAVWTGANDRGTEGGWRWSNNMPFAFFYWAPGQPSTQQLGEGQDCVAMFTQSALWDDVDCTSRNGYICEKKGNVPATTVRTTPTVKIPAGMVLGCQQGWLPFRNSCYRIVSRSGSYSDAQSFCGRMGGNLVSILDSGENDFIVANLPKGVNSWDGFWIGLNDIQIDNRFQWSDGQTVTYTNWQVFEPNNWMNRDEDCVIILLNNGKWNDERCDDTRTGFVCKAPKSAVSATQAPWQQGCPQYTQGVGPYCYRAVNYGPPKSWDDANTYCKTSMNGTLATVNDRILEAFLSSSLTWRTGYYWIGLSDKANPGQYSWATGDSVQYTNWYNTHTGNERSTCVAMRAMAPTGLWENQDCSTTNWFICQFARTGYTPTTTPTPWPNVACPSGWTTNQGFCLKAFANQTTVKTWMEALAYCQMLGGDLPSFHSNNNDSVLQTMLSQYNGQSFWIGLNDRAQEKGHVWSDGSAVDYTNWLPGEPNDYHGYEDCVSYVSGQGWNDLNCYVSSPYICAVPRGANVSVAATVAPTGAPSLTCGNDPNWLLYNSNCYYMSPPTGDNASLSWYDANTYCTSMQSNLFSMHSQDEHSFLLAMITKSASKFGGYWTGFNMLRGDSYQWTDQTPVDFDFWLPNQPDDYFGSERCVEMRRNGFWNDDQCSTPKAFVCKKPQAGAAPIVTPAPYPSGGCAQGFARSPGGLNKCFYIAGAQPNTRLNWTSAYQLCRKFGKGYDIASIEDIFEQEFLITLAQGRKEAVWIGLNDRRSNNHFYWQNNAPLYYTNWDMGEPTSSHQGSAVRDIQNCVMMRLDTNHEGRWADIDCSQPRGYICQSQQDPNLPALGPPQGSCRAGYKWFVNSCYKVGSTYKSWNDAQTDCQADGGNLASLNNAAEAAFVVILVNSTNNYWIGLSDAQIPGLYAWIDGWPVAYSNWGYREPSYGNNGTGCVNVNARGRWNDTDCTTQLQYVCKISTAQPPQTTGAAAGSCQDPSWIPNGGFCYSVQATTGRSWPEANYICQNQGQQLVSIHSQDELDFVVTLVRQAKAPNPQYRPNVWIGLSQGGQGSYQWSDLSTVNFIKWKAGEPSKIGVSGQIENCVELDRDDATYNDIDCFTNRGLVCKSPIVSSTTIGTAVSGPGQGQGPPQGPGVPTGSNVLPTYIAVTDSNGVVVGQGASNLPQVTYPNGQPITNANGQVITPGKLAQSDSNVRTSSSNLGMSSGSIAGVVIGCVIVILLAAFLLVYLKRKGTIKPPILTGSDIGFENATYNKGNDHINIYGADTDA